MYQKITQLDLMRGGSLDWQYQKISKKSTLSKLSKKLIEKEFQKRESILYQNNNYPPIYVLSVANLFANGEEYLPSDFSGGDETFTEKFRI